MSWLGLILFPVALVYHFAISVRHAFFNWGILSSRKYNIPLISVGNLSLGGTGKTPHIEYLIRLLSKQYKTATLSRGYRRKTKGFLIADDESTYLQIGDEPLQYKTKFNHITVAVDGNRRRGIENLMNQDKDLELILLDDAYQHRYVQAGLSILLTDFHSLYPNDYLIPSGTLRDTGKAARRADIIIVTKTPKVLSPLLKRSIIEILKPKAHQQLFFSYLKYGDLQAVPSNIQSCAPQKLKKVLMFTGIANPYPLKEHLDKKAENVSVINFPDHHSYNQKDIAMIKRKFEDIMGKDKLIVTTEKDAMRLREANLLSLLDELPIFYIPIEIHIHKEERASFDQLIKQYVSKNKRNKPVPKEQDKSTT